MCSWAKKEALKSILHAPVTSRCLDGHVVPLKHLPVWGEPCPSCLPPSPAHRGGHPPPELWDFTKPTRFRAPSAQLSAEMLQTSPKTAKPAGGWTGSGHGPVAPGDAGAACSPARLHLRSHGDLCKAPSARPGLFLSLAALTLTFLAVPLAPALLANPFYRRLNIAQAAKQNLLGTATWGSAALPQPRCSGGAASTGVAPPAPAAGICHPAVSPALSPMLPAGPDRFSPPRSAGSARTPRFSGVLPPIWSIWSLLGSLMLEARGGKARLAAVPNKEQPRGCSHQTQNPCRVHLRPTKALQRGDRTRGWARLGSCLSCHRDASAGSMNSLNRH